MTRELIKILILILSLLIIALVSFLVVNNYLGKKEEKKQSDESNTVNAVDIAENESEYKKSDFVGDWNNGEDTDLTINNDGTFSISNPTTVNRTEFYNVYSSLLF